MYFSASNTCFATTFQNTKTKPSFLPQKRDIHDNIESKKRCNDASFANYKTGYFSFVYLIGDERHHIAGDSLRTDSLNLVDSKRIYTSLYKTFNAGSVIYSREVNYKRNTLCLPYTFNASGNSTADFYEIKKFSNDTIYLSRINGTVEAGVPCHSMQKANNDKIVINATNVQVVENPINVFQNNYYFIGDFTTNELFLSNNGYIIDNDCFKLYSDLQKGSQVAPKTLKIVIDKDATSIKPVQFDEEGFKEYYDVTGIRLNALQKGVNIIKTDKKQRK